MKSNLKNFPDRMDRKYLEIAVADRNQMRADYQHSVDCVKWEVAFCGELGEKKDKELSLLQYGQLSDASKELSRVLILRYREILGE